MRRALLGVVLASALAAGLAGCGADGETAPAAPDDRSTPSPAAPSGSPAALDGHPPTAAPVARPRPLRAGERRTTLRVPTAYTPSPPTGVGTDDYRCFLLDPRLAQDAWLTGTDIAPGNPDVVHHVILFRVDGSLTREAERRDAESADPGWTCFGGMGLEGELDDLDDASWLGAWAPGGRETVTRSGYGVPLDRGDKIVMQVHYSLLLHPEGDLSDRSATRLRWTPRSGKDLQEIHTLLLPAPVELPCRPEHSSGPLCTHDASVTDVKARFGERVGQTANLLHLLCGTEVAPSDTTTCTRQVTRPMTVLGVAGHMHLLGRTITVESDAGTPDARTLLDVPLWNFDDQAARPVDPVHLDAGDTLTVTCRHDQSLRDLLPAFAGTQEKYVVWGEGSADEMCLGIVQAVFDE
ncbi:hypothetical protein [Nocardioides rubriscoriae]|uniref:hypothetical protein n=1 Tax=Nocardioides rubriscoriae TaxID=642762 RepID=UPI001B882071|nr:hypothetical protein [Nocardioides rubriscoriae]